MQQSNNLWKSYVVQLSTKELYVVIYFITVLRQYLYSIRVLQTFTLKKELTYLFRRIV
jgi:hypothetical protein